MRKESDLDFTDTLRNQKWDSIPEEWSQSEDELAQEINFRERLSTVESNCSDLQLRLQSTIEGFSVLRWDFNEELQNLRSRLDLLTDCVSKTESGSARKVELESADKRGRHWTREECVEQPLLPLAEHTDGETGVLTVDELHQEVGRLWQHMGNSSANVEDLRRHVAQSVTYVRLVADVQSWLVSLAEQTQISLATLQCATDGEDTSGATTPLAQFRKDLAQFRCEPQVEHLDVGDRDPQDLMQKLDKLSGDVAHIANELHAGALYSEADASVHEDPEDSRRSSRRVSTGVATCMSICALGSVRTDTFEMSVPAEGSNARRSSNPSNSDGLAVSPRLPCCIVFDPEDGATGAKPDQRCVQELSPEIPGAWPGGADVTRSRPVEGESPEDSARGSAGNDDRERNERSVGHSPPKARKGTRSASPPPSSKRAQARPPAQVKDVGSRSVSGIGVRRSRPVALNADSLGNPKASGGTRSRSKGGSVTPPGSKGKSVVAVNSYRSEDKTGRSLSPGGGKLKALVGASGEPSKIRMSSSGGRGSLDGESTCDRKSSAPRAPRSVAKTIGLSQFGEDDVHNRVSVQSTGSLAKVRGEDMCGERAGTHTPPTPGRQVKTSWEDGLDDTFLGAVMRQMSPARFGREGEREADAAKSSLASECQGVVCVLEEMAGAATAAKAVLHEMLDVGREERLQKQEPFETRHKASSEQLEVQTLKATTRAGTPETSPRRRGSRVRADSGASRAVFRTRLAPHGASTPDRRFSVCPG